MARSSDAFGRPYDPLRELAESTASRLARGSAIADLISGHARPSLTEEIARAMAAPFPTSTGQIFSSDEMRRAMGLSGTSRDGSFGALASSLMTSPRHLWADAIAPMSAGQIASTLGIGTSLRDEIERLSGSALHLLRDTDPRRNVVRDAIEAAAGLGTASTKMSLLAASMDALGPKTMVADAAFHALLGDWRSHANLPEAYWRSWPTRQRMYREAEVDPELIEAEAGEVVEALVESGMVEGAISPSGTVSAILEVGGSRMTVSARRPRHQAYDAITALEDAMRRFVADKLAAHEGDEWFKRRVPGDVVRRAKERRQAAMLGSEDKASLIEHIDLGDFVAIVLKGDNWRDVFGPVFGNAEHFKVDLERLNINRRPAMHTRKVDPVRLAETLIVIQRLEKLMAADGRIDQGWDDDN